MKKSIICGIAAFAMAATPMFSVFAEAPQAGTADGYFMGSKDATVGEVDETVYSVDLNWGDMVFDWKYNPITNGYAFVSNTICQMPAELDVQYLSIIGNLYSDYACTEAVKSDGPIELEGHNYSSMIPSFSTIKLQDNSINGKVKARASFAPSDNYSWVNGVFSDLALSNPRYVYTTNTFDSYEASDGTFKSGMGSIPLPGEPLRQNSYVLFHLEIDEEAEYDANSVSPNDKIGAITINIEPDLNENVSE